ncbi:MAG: hypothetical protein HOV66_03680 [Streptomycetaceae bacterium]|nr:hypothetical protein [Streptomycetaceae bacterium]NUS53950.1 hypothetical protein [Streptomycetaceae bacterium]
MAESGSGVGGGRQGADGSGTRSAAGQRGTADSDREWLYALWADEQWRAAEQAAKDNLEAARAIGRKVCTRFAAELGADHEAVLHIRGVLAAWGALGAHSAEREYTALFADRMRIQGPDHPATIAIRGRIAEGRRRAGDVAGATTAYTEFLADLVRVHGPDHESTFGPRFQLAYLRAEAGDTAGAARDLAGIVADETRVMGPDHPRVLGSRAIVATWRGQNGDPRGAARAFAALLADSRRVLDPDDRDIGITRYRAKYWRRQARWWRRVGRPAR